MGRRQFFASIRRNQSLFVQLGIIAAAVGGVADSQLEVWIASYLTSMRPSTPSLVEMAFNP